MNIQDWCPLEWTGWISLQSQGLSRVQHHSSKALSFLYSPTLIPGGSDSKAFAYNAGDPGSIPGLGRSPGEGNGNPLQYLAWKIPWTEKSGRLQSMGLQRVGHNWVTSLTFSLPYRTPGKTTLVTRRTFAGKVISLLSNMLSRLVIAFLPRSKSLFISWLQSPFAVILEPRK